MPRLFGTDGVRGIANRELGADLALALGRSAARVLSAGMEGRPRVLVGMDTRLSGDMLEAALAAGLTSAGADVVLAGVVSTPGVAWLVQQDGYHAGIMISASHNPYEYNGIKLFSSDGFKLPDAVEDEIVADMEAYADGQIAPLTGACLGRVRRWTGAAARYRDYLRERMGLDLSGMRIGLDCANGSAAGIAPELFASLGARTRVIGASPDGRNINDNCGSLYCEQLAALVRAEDLDLGLAFDGDADRLIAIDDAGSILDGDRLMALIARWLDDEGRLPGRRLVATVMSNVGLARYCESAGIELLRAQVGDRYVLEMMRDVGARLGGEQSGHIIMLEHATTGDGILASLALLHALRARGQSLREALADYRVYPQVLHAAHIPNGSARRLLEDAAIREAAAAVEAALDGQGRLLLRPSGTEPVLRVMLEGSDVAQIEGLARELVARIEARAHEMEV